MGHKLGRQTGGELTNSLQPKKRSRGRLFPFFEHGILYNPLTSPLLTELENGFQPGLHVDWFKPVQDFGQLFIWTALLVCCSHELRRKGVPFFATAASWRSASCPTSSCEIPSCKRSTWPLRARISKVRGRPMDLRKIEVQCQIEHALVALKGCDEIHHPTLVTVGPHPPTPFGHWLIRETLVAYLRQGRSALIDGLL